VKFTPKRGIIELETELLEQVNDDITIKISVSDTGIGISDEQRSRLFNSFEQAESNIPRKFGGTGLGLVISKNIVEMMDGTISVESKINEWSTFTFTIKVKIGSKRVALKENTYIKSVRALVVDDMPEILEHFVSISEREGFSCHTALSGNEALEMIDKNGYYDIYFIDWNMPEMDGFTATEQIRAFDFPNAKTIPIVAMTANVFQSDVNKCIETGMNGHIGKPLNFDEVLEVLHKYLA